MRIIPFDQLNDPYGFVRLMEPAFGWVPTPRRLARWRRLDARYREPFGFVGMEGDRPVGFVGVMDIPVRTLDRGTETVGGIHAVATDPNLCRKGISTKLFRAAHRHFRDKGYRFSFLCTYRGLVAWNLYAKLGYTDTPTRLVPRAYRILERRPGPKTRLSRKKPDARRIERLFRDATKDRTGFTARIDNWPAVLIKARELKPGDVLARPNGYAFLQTGPHSVFVSELVARDRDACEDLVDRVLRLGKPEIVVGYVYDPTLRSVLERRGFRFRSGRHTTVMCKPLARTGFDRAFGDRFRFTALDDF